MRTAVITHFRRSPFHFANKGALAKVRPDDLAGQVIAKLVADSGVDPNDIEDIMLGCAFPEGEQGLNLGRMLAFIANLPISVAGTTVNRFCGSSMQSIHMAVGAIAVGAGDVFVCAGVESMSRVPMAGFNPLAQSRALRALPAGLYLDGRNGGESGEEIPDLARYSRKSWRSPRISAPPRRPRPGKFDEEIVPITGQGRHGCDRWHHPARHQPGGAGRPEARFRHRRLGHRGHLLASDRWRLRGAGCRPRNMPRRMA